MAYRIKIVNLDTDEVMMDAESRSARLCGQWKAGTALYSCSVLPKKRGKTCWSYWEEKTNDIYGVFEILRDVPQVGA